MPCVGDVVSEKVLRVPNDTSVESVCRMFAGFTSASAAATSGLLARPIRWSIDVTGPDDGLSADTVATVAGAPHAARTAAPSAAIAHVTILESFTVVWGENREAIGDLRRWQAATLGFGPCS